jgi:anti-sigma B factor antagonist
MDITVGTDGTQVTVRVAGEVDAHNCAELGEAILEAATDEGATVALDAAQLGFIDSSAISELLRVRNELDARGGGLTIVNAGSSVRRVLEITGLLETFGVT